MAIQKSLINNPTSSGLKPISKLFSYTFSFYKKNWKTLLSISFWIGIFSFLLNILMVFVNGGDSVGKYGIIVTPISLLLFIGIFIATFLGSASMILFIRSNGKKTELKPLLKESLGKFWPLVWTTILMAIFLLIGAIALLIPALILAIYYLVAPYIVINEGKNGWSALKRSMQLVSGNWWRICGRYLLLSICLGIFYIPVMITNQQTIELYNSGRQLFIATYAFLYSIIILPIGMIYFNDIYNDLIKNNNVEDKKRQSQNIEIEGQA